MAHHGAALEALWAWALVTGVSVLRHSATSSRVLRFLVMDWSSCKGVEQDLERVGGAWVFCGTRVPIAALFQNLKDGASVSEFVDWFPGVTIDQVRGVLKHAARSAMPAEGLREKIDRL